MSLDVLDWRRQVFALYREVRAEVNPVDAHGLWVAGRTRLVAEHPASPNPTSVLHHAAYDPALRFEVPVSWEVDPARLEVPTEADGVVPFERIGRVDLDGLGWLDVWWLESYGGGVWIPIRDRSAKTYGGGRYLLDTVKGADLGGSGDQLVIDLNFAYNPSCAYSEEWVCPLAPAGNMIDVELEVGELIPT